MALVVSPLTNPIFGKCPIGRPAEIVDVGELRQIVVVRRREPAFLEVLDAIGTVLRGDVAETFEGIETDDLARMIEWPERGRELRPGQGAATMEHAAFAGRSMHIEGILEVFVAGQSLTEQMIGRAFRDVAQSIDGVAEAQVEIGAELLVMRVVDLSLIECRVHHNLAEVIFRVHQISAPP